MSSETTQVIYSMNRVGRFVPPNKQILRDISLGFYYGAKIGVLGLNGAGKSTLLRIMAGLDNDYTGEIFRSPGYATGLLAQEPVLDETKTVMEVVREAVQPIVDLMSRYDEVNAKFADPDADFDALAAELQEHCKQVTAPYKYPREIEFVTELPKTISGKIRRIELRQKSS